MYRSMVDIHAATAEIRRGKRKKKKEKKKKPHGKNIMSAYATQGGHNEISCIGKSSIQLTHAVHSLLHLVPSVITTVIIILLPGILILL